MADNVSGDSVTVEGPGGLKAAATGSQTILALLALLLGLWIWYVGAYVHDAKADERSKVQVVATEQLANAIKEQTKAIKAQDRTQRTMVWVLTLPQAKRERLNLAEPEQIRELQRMDRDR